MSKGRGAAAAPATGTSLREYAAAEDRLLDFFSPLSTEEAAAAPGPTDPSAGTDVAQQNEVDPSRDNMLAFISDDTELHSLLANSENSFKGFDNDMQENDSGGGDQSHVYGVHLSIVNSSPKRVVLSPQITNAPLTLMNVRSTNDEYLLSNGIGSHSQQSNEEQMEEIEEQHVMEDSDAGCVIYDNNVVLLTDDQCCEIIVTHSVHPGAEMERAYLMAVEEEQELNNGGVVYSNAEDEEPSNEAHVYLSDAAMVLDQQHQQHQQLILDTAVDEETPQVSDSYVDDICEVYDHELEEHDDECVVVEPPSSLRMQMGLQEIAIEEQQEPEEQPTILIASDGVEDQQQEHEQEQEQAAAAVPHSSTTEFPVSSTSMPNGSDYDDYDDDVGTAEEQSPPHPRKYAPLKNTLSADAMDRRLANICQAQPQMSFSEKMDNWNCALHCDVVEDVENFEAEFEQHEAKPAVQPKFNEFYDKLRQSNAELTRDLIQQTAAGELSAIDAHDTPYSSEDVAIHKRPNYRRLLQHDEPIVLDDDDDEEDDDDCIEVHVTPSIKTLVPVPEPECAAEPEKDSQPESQLKVETQIEQHTPERVGFNTIQTQTLLQSLQTKETSTTDLGSQEKPSSCVNNQSIVPDELLYQAIVTEQYTELENSKNTQQPSVLEQKQQGLEYHNHVQLNEQHEFCNYLGLTELATANAVATAMRELANSNVGRRSLRVRTQQQLDRMRNDVRGKRGRQQKEKRDPQHQEDEKQLNSESCNSSVSSHRQQNVSLRGKEPTALANIFTAPAYEMPSARITTPSQALEYFFQSPTGDVEQQPVAGKAFSSNGNALSLEAAFAKVYAAAAPAQNDLHESMQNRLRQARESKPSIYIVKSLNNSASSAVSPNAFVPPSPDRLKCNKTPISEAVSGDVATKTSQRKSLKKTPQKATPKRRRTTAAGPATASTPPDRELITRSMNSKMLRNRKVNMLKTFELADLPQARNKQRLSGGSTGAAKRVATKKTSKKPDSSPAQYLLVDTTEQQQQASPTKSTRIPRTPKRMPQRTSRLRHEQQTVESKSSKRRCLRAKSLPMASRLDEPDRVAIANADLGAVPSVKGALEMQKPLMDTHEFITNHVVVSPPLFTAAIRRYVNAVRSPMEQQQAPEANEEQEEQQHSPPLEGFVDRTGRYSPFAKPALIYPPESSRPRSPHFSRRSRQMAGTHVDFEMDNVRQMQMAPPGALLSFTKGPTTLRNPLAGKNGKVLYMYYELEQLIVLQERIITFWKYSKIFNVLQKPKPDDLTTNAATSQQHSYNIFGANTSTTGNNKSTRRTTGVSDDLESDSIDQHWVYLGGTRRTTNDVEVVMPYANRLCAHNSTPVYIEMRSHQLDHHRRESMLLSLYVNVYYYCEEEMRPKLHSVHLDAVNCDWNQVIYTCIPESRYFVMAWQQEIVMGKPRSGICKYSLTPTLDTLASIREFKQLRHELIHIECLMEDRLIGYGQTRITIWDHRSGDTLMNYDLGFDLGHNLGVMHFPSFEMDQSSLLVLYQHVKEQNKWPELRIIACELSHATPSHRLLHVHRLPSPQFDCQLVAINTGDHLILKSPTDDEIWISITDPRQLTYLSPQGCQRYYTRQKQQVIVMTPETLTVDSITNHILHLATQHQSMMRMAAADLAATTR
ncbi:uncharacterized protein LOC133842054 [Drosophila sulfurigaster albostrigata]|uniref:uncharacterized protein LOC133842054 n=1 Tax=Drosophila sulfurigaster albostrigata TaxID=89887 RepID=UPI002D21888A|nr:uncharacterized protein LOC133842054 [Drosophila sulfurigaster albostrigata]